MALKFSTNMMTLVKQTIKDAIFQARIGVKQGNVTSWYYAASIVKSIGTHYVQVDVPLDHTRIGTGTVTGIELCDADGYILSKISTSISRPTATDDIFFRVKINVKALLA